MMAKRSTLMIGALAALSAASSTQAADLGGARGARGGSMKDDMPVMMQQSAARFYLRADGSYASYDRPSIGVGGRVDMYNTNMDGAWAAGGGVGYYINKNWRADFTLEQRFNSDISGSYQETGFIADSKVGLKSTLGLFNIYYDFDTRSRFTPYVGAGLGFVDHKISAGAFSSSCGCLGGTIDSSSSSSVAGALMAGVAVNLTGRGPAAGTGHGSGDAARNLYLDLGYRFLYLGDADTGAINAVTPAVAAVAAESTISAIHAHEFRVGLRYDIR